MISFVFYSPLYAEYAEHVLRFFNISIEIYCKQSYTRLNFEKHMDTSRAMDRITKEIVQGRPTLVFVGRFKKCHKLQIAIGFPKNYVMILVRTGSANEPANSPIKGYRRVPGGKKWLPYFKRRPGCETLAVNEHRTTMMCSLCRKRLAEPKEQPKQRYRTCLKCKPLLDALPATKITTVMSKRKHQRLVRLKRALQGNDVAMEIAQSMDQPPQQDQDQIDGEDIDMQPQQAQNGRDAIQPRIQPPRLVSKIANFVKTDRADETSLIGKVQVWNRDVNAGRNIMLNGEWSFELFSFEIQIQ